MVVGQNPCIALPVGPLVSIEKGPEFSEIVSRSVDREIVDPVVAEIKARRQPLKLRHVLLCLLFVASLCWIAFCLFPCIRTVDTANAWDDMTIGLSSYETEDAVRISTQALAESRRQKLTDRDLATVFKYRTANVSKIHSDYLRGAEDYLKTLEKLAKAYGGLELKECYIEGVLKALPEEGLREYADTIKIKGDAEWKVRLDRVGQAIPWCDDVLEHLQKGKGNEKKTSSVKLQKVHLLLYRWLLKNVEKSKGERVRSFPDNQGDLGVEDREQAVKIIHDEGIHAVSDGKVSGRLLYNWCIEILVSNSSIVNRIYFRGAYKFFHKGFLNERYN